MFFPFSFHDENADKTFQPCSTKQDGLAEADVPYRTKAQNLTLKEVDSPMHAAILAQSN